MIQEKLEFLRMNAPGIRLHSSRVWAGPCHSRCWNLLIWDFIELVWRSRDQEHASWKELTASTALIPTLKVMPGPSHAAPWPSKPPVSRPQTENDTALRVWAYRARSCTCVHEPESHVEIFYRTPRLLVTAPW